MDKPPPIEGSTVLVVDDTPENLDLLFKRLDVCGFKVLVAQDGQSAIRQAEYAKPDIILLDVMMPGVDGFETCWQLKTNDGTQDIPVIFMTALTDIDHKMQGFAAGGVDYVTKPVDYREVEARIRAHLTIRHLQQNLEAEIIERKIAEDQLRQSAAELQARNEELDAFGHTVAHDLKDPLGVLSLGADVLIADHKAMPEDELHHYLKMLGRNAKKASHIVDELLILATIHKEAISLGPLDMGSIIAEAWQRLGQISDKKNAELILPDIWPIALGYDPWVEGIWVNYLSNAIKYGGRPARITVGATEQDDGMIRFWVRDNGPGLTKIQQAQLFTPFTRLNKAAASGHGLGLSIVRRIVKRLNGQVGVESQGIPGEGTCFSFTLPAMSY